MKTEAQKQLHRDAVKRYRAKYPEKVKERNRIAMLSRDKAAHAATMRKWRKQNNARHRAYMRQYWIDHPDRRKKAYARNRAYAKLHRDELRIKNRIWRHSDPIRFRAQLQKQSRIYRQRHPERVMLKNFLKGTNLQPSDLPPALVELKKLQIELHRTQRQLKQTK